ncbi:MAG: DMT family transporter [Actinomycetota bacterium]|nr:DMT family transporter [Actinomycetota bacterium]
MTVVLVMLSALANASALVLLRKAALAEPSAPSFSLRQLWTLLRRPIWATGMVMIVVGFLLQAAALTVGAVSMVQLLLVMELPFTLILSSVVLGGALRLREWTAVAAMMSGLMLLLYTLAPSGGNPYSTGLTLWVISATLTMAVIATLVIVGRRRGVVKAALYGAATGMASGLVAVLVKAVVSAINADGISGVFTTWWTYLLVLTGSVAFFLLQSALQAGRLVASQPGITLANPLVAMVWGIGVFGEEVRTGVWLVGAVGGAVLIAAGAILLSRSPLLEPHQETAGAAQQRISRPLAA